MIWSGKVRENNALKECYQHLQFPQAYNIVGKYPFFKNRSRNYEHITLLQYSKFRF